MNVPSCRHRKDASPVRQTERGAPVCRLAALHLPKLTEVKLEAELPAHGPEGQRCRHELREQEGEVDGMNGPLQRQDDGSLVSQQEE